MEGEWFPGKTPDLPRDVKTPASETEENRQVQAGIGLVLDGSIETRIQKNWSRSGLAT